VFERVIDTVQGLDALLLRYKSPNVYECLCAFANNPTTDNPDGWNFAMVFTYPNYATLDTLGQKADPITLKHYGSAAKRQAAAERRNQFATVVSSRLTRTIT
jgi:hypothetical protein